MEKVLFVLLTIGSAGGVGLALVTSWLCFRLFPLSKEEAYKAMVVTTLGMALQNGVLLFALASIGTAQVNGRAWLYLLGASITATGLAWLTKVFIITLARKENPAGGES